jgi:hypothetical protein
MKTTILTTSAAAVLIFAAVPSPARASSPAQFDRAQYGTAQNSAYDAGYRAGLRRGEEAARGRRPMDFEREREYRDAMGGYDRRYGEPNRYRDDYRAGFAQGYRDAFNRGGFRGDDIRRGAPGYGAPGYGAPGYGAPGYGAPGYGREVVPIAFENGVRDGYAKGLDDLQHRRYPDVNRQKWYRNGDHDYNGRYGPKDLYRVDYRRGFQEGYSRAFREGRRY